MKNHGKQANGRRNSAAVAKGWLWCHDLRLGRLFAWRWFGRPRCPSVLRGADISKRIQQRRTGRG